MAVKHFGKTFQQLAGIVGVPVHVVVGILYNAGYIDALPEGKGYAPSKKLILAKMIVRYSSDGEIYFDSKIIPFIFHKLGKEKCFITSRQKQV